MNKIVAVCLKRALPLMCLVCMFSGCVIFTGKTLLEHAIEAGADAAVEAAKAIGEKIEDAKAKKEFTEQRSSNPIGTPVESRLTRRTSTLAEGIPVDISPYLVHNYSIAVTEKGIQHSGSEIKFTDVGWSFDESDAVLTFKANKQSYQMNITVTTCEDKVNNRVNNIMKEFAARQFGLELKKIQNFEVKFLESRRRHTNGYKFFDNVFIQDTELCYYQFDVEVEYQKTEVKKEEIQPEHFAVFNKVYRSELTSAVGAALAVQNAIINDAVKLGYKEMPLPIINVVRAVKVTETVESRAERKEREQAIANAIANRERAVKFSKQYSNATESPFTNPAENRLTRRTSTLSGGIPVDVSPYLLNENSFAVTEKGIQHYDPILVFGGYTSYNDSFEFTEDGILFEFDVAVTFEVNKQSRQINATIAMCEWPKGNAKRYVKEYMQKYAAEKFQLDPKTIKKFKVKFLKTTKIKSKLKFVFSNDFIQDIEPCYYQFDVEVEYQQKYVRNEKTPEHFTVYNKVYRSDFTSLPAAVIDVQNTIWAELRKEKQFWGMSLPVINFVKAVKVKQ